jgi:hypothetical protein
MAGDFTPYSTIRPFFGSNVPTWVPEIEAERIASYTTYQEIYWNNPETFRLVARGSENQAIYVPSGRVIVDAVNRYTAPGLNYAVTPNVGTPNSQLLAQQAFSALFNREKFFARFNAAKLYGIINGDMVLHITADPLKPVGSRISLRIVDPAAWFPVYDDDNLDKLLKVHLAEQFTDTDDKIKVRRLTYEWVDPLDRSKGVLSSDAVFEIKDWENSVRPVRVITPPTMLPPQITAFPVYPFKNFEEPGNPYGSSELRGLERVMAAINQSVSDEDIALALDGLGLYATDVGAPVDADTGKAVDWILGPGRVVEQAGNFHRVNGLGSVQPYQDHIGMLTKSIREAAGTSDAAVGSVDVQVAESGIALQLHFAPMLARVVPKDDEIVGVLIQMFYDLQRWLQAFEQVDTTESEVLPALGAKLPVNVTQLISDLATMMGTEPPIISAQTAREILAKQGVQFAPDEAERVAAQQDEASVRTQAELTAGGLGGGDQA